MNRRLTAVVLAVALALTWLPMSALAEDIPLCQEGCTLEAGHEGECCVPAPEEPEPPATEETEATEATETTEPPQPRQEEQPALFARWGDNSGGMMYDFGDPLPVNMMTRLCFFFGTPNSYVPVTLEQLYVEGSLNPLSYMDESILEIGIFPSSGAQPGDITAVCYETNGTIYRFYIEIGEPWNGDSGSGGQGPSGPVLYAQWADGSGTLTELNGLFLNTCSPLIFYFGEVGSGQQLNFTDLTVEGSIYLENQTTHVSVYPSASAQAGETAYVCYTLEGTAYKFPVYILADSGTGGSGEEIPTEPTLFATWDDGTGCMTQFDTLFLNTSSPLIFYFGVPGDARKLSVSELTVDGSLVLTDRDSYVELAPSSAAQADEYACVCYTQGDTTYHFPVYIAADENTPAPTHTFTFQRVGGEAVTSLTLDPEENTPGHFFLDGVQLPLNTVFTTEGSVTLEVVNDEVWVLGCTDTGSGSICYTLDGVTYRIGVNQTSLDDTTSYPNIVTLRYQGEDVTVFVGEMWSQELQNVQSFGDSYGANYTRPFSREFMLGALKNLNENNEALPDGSFYDCVSDVSFQLVNSVNEDGTKDPLNCWISTLPDGQHDGILYLEPQRSATMLSSVNTWKVYVRANPTMGFRTVLRMTFTYDEDPSDSTDPVTYTIDCDGFYQASGDVILDATTNGSLDTAEEMNAAFSSYENLMAWMENNFPQEAASYSSGGMVTIDLPAADYDDLIVVQIPADNFGGLTLRGAADSNGSNLTSMVGLLSRGGIHEIRNVDFYPSDDVTYPGKHGYSFGIMADYSLLSQGDPAGTSYLNDICGVHDCTFTDLYYGMCSTSYGYAGFTTQCTFTGCEFGIYIDCKGFPFGGNNDFTLSTFIGNKTAVCLRNLPGGSTPYSLRICDNIFLNNHKEFKVTTPGNKHYYYFYRNYYSGKNQDTQQPYALRSDGPRPAGMDVEGTAVLITEPCRTSAELWESNPLWVFGDTSILNNEADDLLISTEALEANTPKINILDESETQIAMWNFGETEGGTK